MDLLVPIPGETNWMQNQYGTAVSDRSVLGKRPYDLNTGKVNSLMLISMINAARC